MNILNIKYAVKDIFKDINSADIIAYIFCMFVIYNHFSTDGNGEIGSLYLGTLALFFFGVSHIIDAINKIETRIIIVADPNLTVKVSDEE
jgi:hypothetical protein